MTPPRIVLIGAVESTRIALEALIEARCAPDLLVTLPLELAHMHSDFVDLAPLAESHSVPVLPAANVNSEATVERVRASRPDFIFVIGWSRLLGTKIRECAAKGVLGYHPSPLPRGRGRSALSWTILLGMPRTAGSLFWIDEGVDSGPIAKQLEFALSPRVDLPELYAQHMSALRTMLGDLLSDLKAGLMPAVSQDEQAATYFAARRPDDGLIDWTKEASEIDRLVRAVTRPYPGAFTFVSGRRMTIWKGEVVKMNQWHALPGQVFLVQEGAAYVRCGNDTTYRIEEYEIAAPAGETPVPLKGQPRLGGQSEYVHA